MNNNQCKDSISNDEFAIWLKHQDLSLKTVDNYIKAVKRINNDYKYNGQNYLDFINYVKKEKDFQTLNSMYHNTFSCAMGKYMQFLNEKNDCDVDIIQNNQNIDMIQINSVISNLSYTRPIKFKLYNETYTINNWADYIVNLAKCLIKIKPEVIISQFSFSQTQRTLWSNTGTEFIAPKQITQNLFLETNYSGTAICKMSIELLKFYDIKDENFELYYVTKQNQCKEVDWNEINEGKLTKYSYSIPTRISVFGCNQEVDSWLDAFYNICNVLIDKDFKINDCLTFIKIKPNDYDKDHYGTKKLKNGLYLQTPYVVSTILRYILLLINHNKISFDKCRVFYKDKTNKTTIVYSEKTNNQLPNISEQEKKQLRACFVKYFKHGYKIGSLIDYKRLINFYSLDFSKGLLISQEETENFLLDTSIKVDDRIIDEDNIVPKTILDKVINSVDEKFINNYYMIYYKDVYEEFKDDFITTNILNESILKEYLSKKFSNKYSFERNYFQSKTNSIDLKCEIKKYFDGINEALTINQIKNFFVGVSEEKIKQVLNSDVSFINISKNTYCELSQFNYNEKDINKALLIVEKLIQRDGFALRDRVIEILQQTVPDLVNNNLLFGNVGICKVLEILFNNDIRFSRYVFIKAGQDFAFSKMLLSSLKANEEITMQQLQSISEEMGIALSKYYLSELSKEYIRIDENKFVKKDLITFDIQKIDDILSKFTSDFGYIAFDEINNYSQFPAIIGYVWNKFLLESYIENYSVRFVVETDSNSINKVIGFIVSKKLNIKNFDNFIEKVLIDSKIKFENKDDVLDYLFNIKLLGKRRYQNIDEILKRINVLN